MIAAAIAVTKWVAIEVAAVAAAAIATVTATTTVITTKQRPSQQPPASTRPLNFEQLRNVTIDNNTFNNNLLVDIDFNSGIRSGKLIRNNTVIGNIDSGIALIGVVESFASPVGGRIARVANNTVTDNGRFGIEMKNPSGDGLGTGDWVMAQAVWWCAATGLIAPLRLLIFAITLALVCFVVQWRFHLTARMSPPGSDWKIILSPPISAIP